MSKNCFPCRRNRRREAALQGRDYSSWVANINNIKTGVEERGQNN